MGRQQQQQAKYGNKNGSRTPPTSEASEDNMIDRLEHYERRVHGATRQEEEELRNALAWRSYHLPGHSYCEDWVQYFQNNHPIFGICCHYRLHPMGVGMRLLNLFGSLLFGLLITNAMWLFFFYRGADYDRPAVTISLRGFGDANNSTIAESQSTVDDTNEIEITQGMLLLWTLGGCLHALYDNTMWYVAVCVCCLSSQQFPRFKCCATYCVSLMVLFLTSMATLAIVLRTSIEDSQSSSANDRSLEAKDVFGLDDDSITLKVSVATTSQFILAYAAEFVLAIFVYYPIVGTILFSGYLGCFRLPIIGGRPYEVKQEALRKERQHDIL